VMTNKDTQKFRELMATLQEVFTPEKPISKAKMEIYFQTLEGYQIEDISTAVSKVVRTKEYPTFPLPVDIIKAMTEPEDIEGKALEAWNQANKALSYMCINERCGDDVSRHPLTEAVVSAFGSWEKMAFLDPFNDRFDRQRFIDCFKSTEKKEIERKLLDGNKPRQLT